MYSLRIDAREFEEKHKRKMTPEEAKNLIIGSFEKNKGIFNENKEEYDVTLKDALAMHEEFLKGNYTDVTNDEI